MGAVQIAWMDFSAMNIEFDLMWSILSEDERVKASQIVVPPVRMQSIQSRFLLRSILGQSLGILPEAIQFDYGENAKPLVEGLYFNVSHAAGRWCVALSKKTPVGLDIEQVKPEADVVSLESYLKANEMEWVGARESSKRQVMVWSAKEAAIKLDGGRLFPGLARYEVLSENDCITSVFDHERGCVSAFCQLFDLGEGYVAVLCTKVAVQVKIVPISSCDKALIRI